MPGPGLAVTDPIQVKSMGVATVCGANVLTIMLQLLQGVDHIPAPWGEDAPDPKWQGTHCLLLTELIL